jgi:hypothetical protein
MGIRVRVPVGSQREKDSLDENMGGSSTVRVPGVESGDEGSNPFCSVK